MKNMNLLVEKNLSQSQVSNINQLDLDNDDDDSSFFYRLTKWLHLIKRWKHESLPEVCKHMHKSSLNSKKNRVLYFYTLLRLLYTNINIHNCLKAY